MGVSFLLGHSYMIAITPMKTNMSPENQWLKDVSPTEIVPFYGTFVRFRGCMLMSSHFCIFIIGLSHKIRG